MLVWLKTLRLYGPKPKLHNIITDNIKINNVQTGKLLVLFIQNISLLLIGYKCTFNSP